MTLRRTLEQSILAYSSHFKVLLLTGMRQVGKTTLLKELCRDGTLFPIEIKVSASPDASMAKHFKVLEQSGMNMGTGVILCLTDRMRPLSENLLAMSIWDI